jgi:hypothetical protein
LMADGFGVDLDGHGRMIPRDADRGAEIHRRNAA